MRKGRSKLSKSSVTMAPLKSQNTWITSKKTEIHDCYEVLESSAWIWRVLGIFPITITSALGTKRYVINKFFAAHGLLIFAMCIINLIYVMIHRDFYFRGDLFRITTVTSLIRTVASLMCLFVSTVYRVLRYSELSGSINKISEQSVILEKMNCRLNYESSIKIIRINVWTSVGAVLYLMAYDLNALLRSYHQLTIQYVLWNIGLMTQVLDLTIFVTLVGLLGLNFHALNEKMRTVVTRANATSPKVIVTSDVCAENLRLISKAHYNTCALGKRINSIFDFDIIINVVTAFIILSTTLYYIFYEVQREGETSIIRIVSYIHWEFFHSAPIIIVVIICNWTSNQAIYIGKLIHEIRVEKTDSRLYEVVKSFSLQLHHQKLEFTACGFFPINSTLLQTMIGNITTYLVILIQFEPKLD